MRILFLQRQPCVKTLKYAVGLRSAAPGIELGFAYQGRTLAELYGGGDELFDSWWQLPSDPSAQLSQVLAQFQPDVIHSHNLPDVLTVIALELTDGRVPVVHDVHDFQSLRKTPYEDGFPDPIDPLAAERAAIEGSTALVTVSAELLAEIDARYQRPDLVRVFPNYALRRDFLPPSLPSRHDGPPRVVYQGTLSVNGGHYDLRDLFRSIVAGGVTLDIHPARPAPEYRELAAVTPGLRCHEPLPAHELLALLPRYDFGWAGFNDTLNAAHLDTALPNKAFEYVACGLPVLTLRHKALARWVQQERVGIALESLDDLGGQLAALDVPALHARTVAIRERFTVEANIATILDLYADVADIAVPA